MGATGSRLAPLLRQNTTSRIIYALRQAGYACEELADSYLMREAVVTALSSYDGA
jgi:hypothetical protein